MTKSALAATSLVAAVPGGFMAYLAVMAFLNHLEGMPLLLMVVTGTALAFSALMALSPVGILLFSKGAPKPDKPEESGLAETADVATVPARDSKSKAEADEAGFTPAEDFETEGEEDEGSSVGADSEETILASGDSEFELEDDAFEFDDEDSK